MSETPQTCATCAYADTEILPSRRPCRLYRGQIVKDNEWCRRYRPSLAIQTEGEKDAEHR